MKTELVDIRGDLVALADDTFVVEEARTYRLRAPGAASVWLGEVALARTAAGHYEVVLGHYVGSLSLRLAAPDGSVVHHRVDVRPRTNKLPPGLWLKLLTELEAGLAGLSVGALGPTQGAVDTRGVSAPLLVSALLPLIPALIAALRAILDAPRWIDREHQDERQLHECRRIDSSTLAWIGRHPDVGRWLDGWRASELLGRPPRVPISSTLGTLDHPVNRTVAWLTHQVVKQLIAVADRLDELAAKIDDPVWCRGRATRARGAADQLCRLRDRSWLRGVPPEPPSEAAFLVLADDPTYARFHRIARRFCVPMFRLESATDEPGAAVRPSFSLYELWCLFALRRLLGDALPGWQWKAIDLGKLLTLTGPGSGAGFVAQRDDQRLRIAFNPRFPSWYCRDGGPHSLSGERRPDFVVTLDNGPLGNRWVVLDAKYRAGRENLASALASVHLYRDALVDPARGGRCAGAMLLVPGACEIKEWFAPAWQRMHGLGITTLAPDTPAPNLVPRMRELLGLP